MNRRGFLAAIGASLVAAPALAYQRNGMNLAWRMRTPLALKPSLWLEATEAVSLRSSQFVTSWGDRSGFGNHAVQATEADQPDYAVGINGLPAPDFEIGSTQYMSAPASASLNNLPLNGGFYGLFVLKPESLVGTDYFISKLGFSPSAGWRIAVGTSGVFELIVNFSGGAGKWQTQTGLVVAGTPLIFEVAYDGSATTNDPVFWFNGALTTVNEPNTPVGSYTTDASYALTIGGTEGNGDYDGMISRVVLLPRIPAADEQAALRSRTAAKWQIPLT